MMFLMMSGEVGLVWWLGHSVFCAEAMRVLGGLKERREVAVDDKVSEGRIVVGLRVGE